MVIFSKVVSEDVSVHEGAAALAQDVEALLKELHLDPGHIVLLHLLHLVFHHRVQLVLKLERLQVVHVPVVIAPFSSEGFIVHLTVKRELSLI